MLILNILNLLQAGFKQKNVLFLKNNVAIPTCENKSKKVRKRFDMLLVEIIKNHQKSLKKTNLPSNHENFDDFLRFLKLSTKIYEHHNVKSVIYRHV